MKKIITGFLGIFLVLGIVAGTGYALFSDTVSMTGMVLGTATPTLEIRTDEPNLNTWTTTLNFGGAEPFAPLLPGEYDWGEFYLRNQSDGTTDPLDFKITGKISSVVQNTHWDLLKEAVQARICVYDKTEMDFLNCGADRTAWHTLKDWKNNSYTLPGGSLKQGTKRHYAINFFIDSSYTNTIAGKTITSLTIEFLGEQVL